MFANLRQQPYRVAIEGFSDFERASLAACFRLAEGRVPAYVQVTSISASDFVVVDADHAEALARVTRDRRAGDVVFIGSVPPAHALAWLLRPIDPSQVMRALDTLLGTRLLAEPGAAQAPDTEAPAAAIAVAATPPPKRRPNRATATPPRGGEGRPVLVVDDSRVACAFLSQRLRALGYRVSVASTAEEALALAAEQAFSIVFLDLKLGDHDPLGGLDVCRAIKQQRPRADDADPPPAVVITTASGGASDRVRGSLAGCDAYLTKPLHAHDFTEALRHVDPLFAGAVV